MDPVSHNQLLEAIRSYRPPAAAEELVKQHPPLLVAGTSSVGKNTVADTITKLANYRRVITHTTREPWNQEANGITYWFTSENDVMQMLSDQALIEAQLVHGETIYATSTEAYEKVARSEFKPLIIVDIHGISKYLRMAPSARAVFLLPPTFDEWMRRFEKRGIVSFSEKKRRLHSAGIEMDLAQKNPHVQLIVNEDLNLTTKAVIGGPSTPALQDQNRHLVRQLIDHTRAF